MDSPDTAYTLRPHGATILCILVWAVLGLLAIEAVLATGLGGLFLLPGLGLVAALIWAVLWAPRVALHRTEVEVRNLLHTYRLPFASIEDVRLGAMLRFDVSDDAGSTRTITAWNAPGIGRDHGAVGRTVGRLGGERMPRPTTGTQRRRSLSPGERLRHDQAASRSAVVRERWQAWADAASGTDGPTARAERSVNFRVLIVLGVLLALNGVLLAL